MVLQHPGEHSSSFLLWFQHKLDDQSSHGNFSQDTGLHHLLVPNAIFPFIFSTFLLSIFAICIHICVIIKALSLVGYNFSKVHSLTGKVIFMILCAGILCLLREIYLTLTFGNVLSTYMFVVDQRCPVPRSVLAAIGASLLCYMFGYCMFSLTQADKRSSVLVVCIHASWTFLLVGACHMILVSVRGLSHDQWICSENPLFMSFAEGDIPAELRLTNLTILVVYTVLGVSLVALFIATILQNKSTVPPASPKSPHTRAESVVPVVAKVALLLATVAGLTAVVRAFPTSLVRLTFLQMSTCISTMAYLNLMHSLTCRFTRTKVLLRHPRHIIDPPKY